MNHLLGQFSRAAHLGALCLTLGLAAAAPASAADPGDQAAYERAFEVMSQDPGSSDKALAYAQAAVKVGDLEGAIGALERLLIFNPDLPRIRLELGILYFRLGSYDLARGYLQPLEQRPDVPADVRSKVADYLKQIARKQSAHNVSGGVISGFRYQSNATYGPTGNTLRVIGFDFPVANNALKKQDLNFFGLAGASYVYDFQRADPLTIESNFTVYGAKQFRQSQLDLSLVQIDVGPRIGLPGLLQGSSVRPYVIADYLSLGGSSFLGSYGGGVNAVAPVMPKLTVEANFEVQNRQYWQDPARPRIESRNGNFYAVRLTPRYQIADNQMIGLTGEFDRTDAVQRYERNSQYILGPTYLIKFAAPFAPLTLPWTGTLGFNKVWRNYGTSDILVDPFNTRRDSEWNVGGSLQIGIIEQLSLLAQLQHSWVDSTIPNYSYRNLIGALALSFEF